MDEKYYLTNDGLTYEEMSLYELGRRLLTYDGAEYYYLVHKDLVLRLAKEFVEFGKRKGWLNIPDSVRAFDEEGYKEELQWLKDRDIDVVTLES